MDVATDLVEAFLRYNGYLTVSEMPVQAQNHRGDWETLTDIDILALRFPGPVYVAAPPPDSESKEEFEAPGTILFLEEDTVDVIIGEVKQGEARFNQRITETETLEIALLSLSWIYEGEFFDKVAQDLRENQVSYCPARGGGTVRTRLVAFGQSEHLDMNTIPLSLVIARAVWAYQSHGELFRSARPSSAASAMLKLLMKSGFDVSPGS